jgi:predicted transcriptional regulator
MMTQLLTRVAVGGSVHLGELADELGVTVTVVRDMLRDLALRGYLKPTGGDCTTKCGGCAFSTSCHGDTKKETANMKQTWTLTDKGRRTAAIGAA